MKLETYLTERATPKIYFAHPRATYGKPDEKKAIADTQKKYPDHIIVNPNVSWIQGKVDDMGFDIFFKVIDTVEIIVVLTFPDGKVGGGCYREAEYGLKKGKQVFLYTGGKFTEITKKSQMKRLSPEETYKRIPKKEQSKWKVYE